MKTYFPDTNLFFEFKNAAELEWHQLEQSNRGEKSDIRLLVPPTVITEINRHKTKGNSRTARRARDASALLRKALKNENHQVVLRIENPRVVLELPPVVKIDWSRYPSLDPDQADHRIAAEYDSLVEKQPGLTVLTDDTLLAVAVRSLGHEPVLIPDEWRLEAEKDERDKQIDQLTTEIWRLKQSLPLVTLSIQNAEGDEITTLEANIIRFEPSAEEFGQAEALIQARSPEVTEFKSSKESYTLQDAVASLQNIGQRFLKRVTQQEIDEYKMRHRRWVEEVSERLPQIAAQLTENSCHIPFQVQITNDGYVNAKNVRLTINGYDGVTLLDRATRDDEEQDSAKLPKPPDAPRDRYVSFGWRDAFASPDLGVEHLINPLNFRQRHDANAFYFTRERPFDPVNELELECEALPHRIEPTVLVFRAVVTTDDIRPQPRLRVRLHASNLQEPIDRYVKLSRQMAVGDFLSAVTKLKFETR